MVTGAAGNIGTSLVRLLVADKEVDHLIGLARHAPAVGTPGVEWQQADVSRDDLSGHLRGADALVHLAWDDRPARGPAGTHAAKVEGATRVLQSVVERRVRTVIWASSFAVYRAAAPGTTVDEEWPTTGIPSSPHSRQKAEIEQLLDEFERDHPLVRLVRIRSGFALSAESVPSLRDTYDRGATALIGRALARASVLPDVPGFHLTVVHTEDVAEAYRLALLGSVIGAYNIAAEPLVDGSLLAEILGRRHVVVPLGPARRLFTLGSRLRLHGIEPGWLDIALDSPALDTRRAAEELGWKPTRTAREVIREAAGA